MKKKNKKYIFSVVIGLTIIFIWSNSMRTGDDSMDSSNFVKELVLSFFSMLGIDLKNSFFIEFIRKVGHFTEFFILGTELALYRIFYLKKTKASVINILFIGTVTAFVDEAIQLIPSLGRSAQITDVLIDVFGVISAFLVVFVLNCLSKLLKCEK